jgi:hypothetical protein
MNMLQSKVLKSLMAASIVATFLTLSLPEPAFAVPSPPPAVSINGVTAMVSDVSTVQDDPWTNHVVGTLNIYGTAAKTGRLVFRLTQNMEAGSYANVYATDFDKNVVPGEVISFSTPFKHSYTSDADTVHILAYFYPSEVVGVDLQPSAITLERGSSFSFDFFVHAQNGFPENDQMGAYITGHASPGTTFTAYNFSGKLQIAQDESASSLTVTLYYVANPAISSTAVVTIVAPSGGNSNPPDTPAAPPPSAPPSQGNSSTTPTPNSTNSPAASTEPPDELAGEPADSGASADSEQPVPTTSGSRVGVPAAPTALADSSQPDADQPTTASQTASSSPNIVLLLILGLILIAAVSILIIFLIRRKKNTAE